ncbi:hypothetical protein RND71_002673 [Anisodus tanguticus]|uniref:BRO1 domain-containing protein n=1 Tax=Anisodus tanguticus TaxID=243964 RepID=A0AAE1SUK1_9SOLA|nr:hypothetical protein RND71_002673 [Anisodus tanguticus]
MASPSSTAATNVMLAIFEKKNVSLDLYRPLRNYIVFNYSEREAQNLEDDLQTTKQYRIEIERVPADSLPARRDVLQNYYKALCAKAVQQNIHLEKAAVLFNLGAVHSLMGLSLDRSAAEGGRQASHSFIAAAGAFAFLRDNVAMKASMGSSTTVDMSVECAGMLERLMLAQAQECVFENTIAKGSTPGVSAKISRQVGIFYEEALAALNVAPLNYHFDKGWVAHVQLKAALFYTEACYRYGMELHEKEEIAEEIARLKSGVSALAVKENDRVYLMRVPQASSLPPLPAFSMVKPMPMNDVLDASKGKMFASLVPDSSAKALSRYTEMVDDVIRAQAERLQQGSELARVKLREMGLPDSILALEGNLTLSMALKEEVEAVQICGGPSGLEAELQQLNDLKRVNQELLVQTEELLQKEATEDAQFRSQFGTRWTRPQSSTLTKNLQDRLNRFAANLKQAAESDARIERSVRDHAALMSILDLRPIESALPTLARPIMSLDANEDAIAGALKQSLRQLEGLGAQRAGLEDMLKEMKRKDLRDSSLPFILWGIYQDDILHKLMTSTGSHEDLFRREIAKYDHICEEIAKNLEAQEQLLLQIQVQNEDFASIFNLEDYKASRERIYKQIEAAISKYQEIKENIEGLKFYVTLQDAITNVKQHGSDFVITRNIQCWEMMDEVQRQISGLSFQDNKGSNGYNYPDAAQSHQVPRSNPQPTDPANIPNVVRPSTPTYQPPQQPTMPGYTQNPPPYGTPQQLTPPYNLQAFGPPYPPPQHQQQPPPSHEYGQPAYSGWSGPYYNAPLRNLHLCSNQVLCLDLLIPSLLHIILLPIRVAITGNDSFPICIRLQL